MLTKKEKVISSILCVISVVLLIASLCFTTLLFTTHGTTLKAEAASDITSEQYAEYFSETIFPNGFTYSFDLSYFNNYDDSFGGYIHEFSLLDPFSFDVAYRCHVVLSTEDDDVLYDKSVVFFPSVFNADGTLYYGFCFFVDFNVYVRLDFYVDYITVTVLCPSGYYVDSFVFSEVPSLTISSFYSSYESLVVTDQFDRVSDNYYSTAYFDCFYREEFIPAEDFVFPCFLMVESNVGNMLVFYNPFIYSNDLACFRTLGVPNNFYTFCQYSDSTNEQAFVVLSNGTFDSSFVFEVDNISLVAPVPLNQSSGDDPSINESLGEVLLQGMSFSFDSIGEGITYTFNNLFLDEDGKLSTFTYVIVFTLGIGIVLGFIKWLLSYILSLGGKD